MKLNYNQFLAVVYADIFDWPLTLSEAKRWAIKTSDRKGKYFEFQPREELVRRRKIREQMATQKLGLARKAVSGLARVPTIEGIFLTGSVAVGNATANSDVDLMIITRPNSLWLTRLLVVGILKVKKIYRRLICPNIFLDSEHLEIQEKNLYTAHEVLQAKCLFDRGRVEERWLEENEWTEDYLPNAYRKKFNQAESQSPISNATNQPILYWTLGFGQWILGLVVGFIEIIAFVLQYLYQLPKQTNEKVGWHFAFFHPAQLGQKVEDRFVQRLLKYTS